MRAVRFHRTGGPEVLELDAVDGPKPAAGEVRVAVEYAGVNFIDVYNRTGLYPVAKLPRIAGREGCGRIDALGAGVAHLAIGDRIAFFDAPTGYAEKVVLPALRALPVPAALTSATAAALPLQGLTAHYLVRTIGRVKRGEVVLVHAAAGGVGLLAVQLAKRAGATVLGTVSTEDKAARARAAGCDHPIRYTELDFAEEALRLTGGRGCDLVLDSVGQATFSGSVRATRIRGTLVAFGQSSGLIEPVSPRPALGSRTLVSATLADYVRDPIELAERWRDLSTLAAEDKLEVTIDRIHRLEDAALAHRRLEARETSGKVLLAIDPAPTG